jgi:hypothetical protein
MKLLSKRISLYAVALEFYQLKASDDLTVLQLDKLIVKQLKLRIAFRCTGALASGSFIMMRHRQFHQETHMPTLISHSMHESSDCRHGKEYPAQCTKLKRA